MKNNNKNMSNSRRQFLIKSGKAGLASAFLKTSLASSGLLWAGNVLAQGPAPKRLCIVHVTNGARTSDWHPTMNGTDMVLATSTTPYEPFKQHCAFLDGIDGQGGHGAHHQCVSGNQPNSIDMHVASVIGADTPFSVAHLAVTPTGGLARVNGKGIPMETNPYLAFERFFPTPEGGGNADKTLLRRKGVLATNVSAINNFRARLNAVQSERMDLHEDSILKLEKRFEKAALAGQGANAACQTPIWQGAFNDRTPFDENLNIEHVNDLRADLHMELTKLIFQCDLARVATISFCNSGAEVQVPGYGSWHGVIHGFQNNIRTPLARRWFDSKIAGLMQMLQDTPDIDGNTLLDNTLIYVTSDMGDGNAHTNARTPMMLAGGANIGINGGQAINYGGTSYLRVFDTIMMAMGIDPSAPGTPAYSGGLSPFTEILS